MAETAPLPSPLPAPASEDWRWAPERGGFGSYAGTCTVGPFTFTVSAKEQFGSHSGWELHGSVKLAGVTMATHSWEADTLACTPDGILAEVAARDVLSQLAVTSRRRVAEAAQQLEEFDLISRAYSPRDDAAS